jgi:hypothetical protein
MAGKNKTITGEALYDHFKPQERFVLVLEALARRDEAEADRLIHSCPRKLYEGPDAAFGDRLTMAFEMITIACGDLRHLTASLRTLHEAMAIVGHFDGLHHIDASMAFVEGVRCGQGLPQSPFFAPKSTPQASAADEAVRTEDREEAEGPDDCGRRLQAVEERAEYVTQLIQRVLARRGVDIATQLLSVWEAFGQFCDRRVGLPAEKALEACGFPSTSDLKDAVKVYGGLKADPQMTAEYRDGMCALWDRRFADKQ